MEAVAARAASGAVSRALTLLALFLALLFRAFPSAPVAASMRQDPAAARDQTLGTERGEHDDRTEPLASKPAPASRRNELRDGHLLGDAPPVGLAAAWQPDLLRAADETAASPPRQLTPALRSRDAEPRTSRGPPARG